MLGSYNMRTVGWAAVSTELHFASLHTQQILVHSTQCSVHTEYSTLYACMSVGVCVCSTYHLPRPARILISNMQICSAFDCWWHICYSCLPILQAPFLFFFCFAFYMYISTVHVCVWVSVCACVTCLFACRLLSFAWLGSKRQSTRGGGGGGGGFFYLHTLANGFFGLHFAVAHGVCLIFEQTASQIMFYVFLHVFTSFAFFPSTRFAPHLACIGVLPSPAT